jgi:hypothetical protein
MKYLTDDCSLWRFFGEQVSCDCIPLDILNVGVQMSVTTNISGLKGECPPDINFFHSKLHQYPLACN